MLLVKPFARSTARGCSGPDHHWSEGLRFVQSSTLGGMALLVAVLLIAPRAIAQDDEVSRHGIFIDTLDVSLINLEVFVTRDGQPIADLTAEDFVVTDDGEPVAITNFFRVEAGHRVESAPAVSVAETSPSEPTPQERSSVIVLVDHPFISPMSRKLVFDRLGQQLDALMSAGTRVMLASKDGEVEIAQPATSDRASVQTVLDRLAERATGNYASEVRGTIQAVQNRQATASRNSGPGGTTGPALTSELDARAAFQDVRNHSQQMHAKVRRSLAALRSFLGSLAGLPGRKAVLYVADRLPVRSGELVWRVWYEQYGRDWGTRFGAATAEAALRDYDASNEVRELIADASANRVAFYPIGAGADARPNLAGAESRGLTAPTATLSRVTESDEGLRWLANGTGGQVAIGRGDVEDFFGRLHQDLTHYYSLAYPSPHRGDGETHQVEVRLAQSVKDADIRYLSEYRDKSADHQMEELTLASLMLGVSDNPLDVRVEVGAGKKQKGGLYKVPMEIRIPVANMVLLPDRKTHVGKLSLQLIVRDEKGRLSDPVRIRLPIEVPHGSMLKALSESAAYATELTLRGGRQTVAVGVRDDLGAMDSTFSVDFDVGGRN